MDRINTAEARGRNEKKFRQRTVSVQSRRVATLQSRSPTKPADHKNAVSNLKFIIEESLPKKTMPPFHRLPFYNVGAIILSYFGFRKKVKNLLKHLNRNSRKYFLSHKDILRAFVVAYVPPYRVSFEKVMVFGGIYKTNQRWGCNKDWYPDQIETSIRM